MNLRIKALSVGIWSENYKKLAKWYEKVLELKVKERMNLPNDTYVAFDMGENFFWIGKHSKVKGKNKDKYRHMIGFEVKKVGVEYKNLLKNKAKIIAPPFEIPTGGVWCCTFEDPEKNILQLYGEK